METYFFTAITVATNREETIFTMSHETTEALALMDEARHWVINHLDMSNAWTVERNYSREKSHAKLLPFAKAVGCSKEAHLYLNKHVARATDQNLTRAIDFARRSDANAHNMGVLNNILQST